jgi:hypothetical protein
MPKIIKPTKKDSPAIHRGANRDNKPAESYAAPHTMSGKKVSVRDSLNNGGFRPDPNTMTANQFLPGEQPVPRVSLGDITREPKTDGITMRGYGAATKGIKSRGPMA